MITAVPSKITELREFYREFTAKAYAPHHGVRKVGAFLCYTAVSIYLGMIAVLLLILMTAWYYHNRLPNLASLVVLAVGAPVIFYQGIKLLIIKVPDLGVTRSEHRGRLSWKLMVAISAGLGVFFVAGLLAYYPGAIGWDSVLQWEQVLSGKFNDWHPALHTMIMWIFYQIVPSYPFFLGVQSVVFAILCGYMVATLKAWGFATRWPVLFLVFAVGTHSTSRILLHPWKDTTFTILMLWMAVILINIIFTEGKWLAKWYNVLAVIMVVALLSTVRHNGIFITIPLVVLLVFFYRKASRNVLVAAVGSILVWLGITQGLYRLADVEQPESQSYVEVVGIPMVIMGEVLTSNPDALDPETRDFLYAITDDESWHTRYETGNFNLVKWQCDANSVVAQVPPADFAAMTWRTMKNAPNESLVALAAVTRVVWSPIDWQYSVGYWINEYAKDVAYTDAQVEAMKPIAEPVGAVYKVIKGGVSMLLPDRIMGCIGLHMLALLFFGIYALNRGRGFTSLLVLVPILAYNIGTMLLLCGPDYRYFHFNVVLTLPVILTLLARVCPAESMTEEIT
jgi:hypothetical protein